MLSFIGTSILILTSVVGAAAGGAANPNYRIETRAVHAGCEAELGNYGVVPPISLATTYIQSYPGVKPGQEDLNSYGIGYFYSRQNNPTRGALERALASVEGAKHAAVFSSGMSAITSVMQCLNSGDHVISLNDLYGGTTNVFRTLVAPNSGIKFSFINLDNAAAIEAAIQPNTKMIYLETPTNPLLHTTDIRMIVSIAKKHNLLVAVDGTFMSPYLQRPLELGADIVVHSLTKFIAGHSDVLMGAVITNNDDINKKLRNIQNLVGAVASPFECYLALRGLKTLPVRMEQSQRNAQVLANFLESHPAVEKVVYPGLKSYAQYNIAKGQTSGPGAMITIYVKGGIKTAGKFLQSLKIVGLAVSLGAVESLACSPAIMTHNAVPQKDREAIGLTGSLIRLSIGVEHIDDLVQDFKQALDAAYDDYQKTTNPANTGLR